MNGELPLRGPDMPEPLGWWPPAPGWWLLLVAMILIAILLKLWLGRPRRSNYWSEAQKQLHNIEQMTDSPLLQLQQLSSLLRRMAMLRFGREQSASLTGEAWLQLLDSAWPRDDFSRGAGTLLEDAPYRENPEGDLGELFTIAHEWLQYQQQPQPESSSIADV